MHLHSGICAAAAIAAAWHAARNVQRMGQATLRLLRLGSYLLDPLLLALPMAGKFL